MGQGESCRRCWFYYVVEGVYGGDIWFVVEAILVELVGSGASKTCSRREQWAKNKKGKLGGCDEAAWGTWGTR